MEVDEVIIEAYHLLATVKYHTHGLYHEMKVYDAEEAIKGVRRRTPDDPFWETADPSDLKTKLIALTNSRLAPSGRNYEKLMTERLEKMPAVVH